MNKQQTQLIKTFLTEISTIIENRLIEKYAWDIGEDNSILESVTFALADKIDVIKLTDNRLELINVEISRLKKEKEGLLGKF